MVRHVENVDSDLEKLILVDCDGVLLNWSFGFHQWVTKRGYKKISKHYFIHEAYIDPDEKVFDLHHGKFLVDFFNESAAIGYLPPFRDAVKYVRKLHDDHGFVFHVISSMSSNPLAQKLRIENLKRQFGRGIFHGYTILESGADKNEALKPYRNSNLFWIEDKPENAILGARLGLRSVLFEHEHNQEFITDMMSEPEPSNLNQLAWICNTWEDFYQKFFTSR